MRKEKSSDFGFVVLLVVFLLMFFISLGVFSGNDAEERAAHIKFENYSFNRTTLAIERINTPAQQHLIDDNIKLDLTKKNSGLASWYDYSLPDFPQYSKSHYTAASRDYPRGTILIVCVDYLLAIELRCVQVRVNDYGPEVAKHPERVIDLSSAAYKQLQPLNTGVMPVRIYKKITVEN